LGWQDWLACAANQSLFVILIAILMLVFVANPQQFITCQL
jgi:hypothetical protein